MPKLEAYLYIIMNLLKKNYIKKTIAIYDFFKGKTTKLNS